jgi:NadR type nicotinamide-nucleotide adenylyltransferase
MIRICFHGAESTGKSVLAEKLSAELGLPWVPEFGRSYAETHGTQFTMADLLAIAEGHEAAVQAVAATGAPLALLDTDALMTAAWAQMLFGEVPAALLAYTKADLYLLFDAQVPWVDDGTRLFGSTVDRACFAGLAEDLLVQSGVPFERVGGSWAERETSTRAIVAGLT